MYGKPRYHRGKNESGITTMGEFFESAQADLCKFLGSATVIFTVIYVYFVQIPFLFCYSSLWLCF